MVNSSELIKFLGEGKASEKNIREKFGSCPRKQLNILISEGLIIKEVNPVRYYARKSSVIRDIPAQIHFKEKPKKKIGWFKRLLGRK